MGSQGHHPLIFLGHTYIAAGLLGHSMLNIASNADLSKKRSLLKTCRHDHRAWSHITGSEFNLPAAIDIPSCLVICGAK